jgi:hypothetical protein
MSSTYRFIGTETEIGGEKLTKFGQPVTLTDARAKEAIMGAGPDQGYAGATALIPDEDFQKLKLTDEELKTYDYPGRRARMSPEFKAKHEGAFETLAKIRARYEKEDAKAAKEKDGKG